MVARGRGALSDLPEYKNDAEMVEESGQIVMCEKMIWSLTHTKLREGMSFSV